MDGGSAGAVTDEQISAGKSFQNHLRVTALNLRMLDIFSGSRTRYAQTPLTSI